MAGEEWLELKFRLHDGSDIGPGKYAPSTTIATLKERIVAEWPQDKSQNEMPKKNFCSCTII